MASKISRPFWKERLVAGWKQASIVWLTGPRRVGKTILARSLPEAEFFNCDLPGVAERWRDQESFYRSAKKRFLVLDEVHQLPDPSRLRFWLKSPTQSFSASGWIRILHAMRRSFSDWRSVPVS